METETYTAVFGEQLGVFFASSAFIQPGTASGQLEKTPCVGRGDCDVHGDPVVWPQPPAEQNRPSLAVVVHISVPPRLRGWMMNVTHPVIHYSPRATQPPEGTASFTDTSCPTSVTLTWLHSTKELTREPQAKPRKHHAKLSMVPLGCVSHNEHPSSGCLVAAGLHLSEQQFNK